MPCPIIVTCLQKPYAFLINFFRLQSVAAGNTLRIADALINLPGVGICSGLQQRFRLSPAQLRPADAANLCHCHKQHHRRNDPYPNCRPSLHLNCSRFHSNLRNKALAPLYSILTKYAIDSMSDADGIYRMKRYRSVAGRTYRIYIFKIE